MATAATRDMVFDDVPVMETFIGLHARPRADAAGAGIDREKSMLRATANGKLACSIAVVGARAQVGAPRHRGDWVSGGSLEDGSHVTTIGRYGRGRHSLKKS